MHRFALLPWVMKTGSRIPSGTQFRVSVKEPMTPPSGQYRRFSRCRALAEGEGVGAVVVIEDGTGLVDDMTRRLAWTAPPAGKGLAVGHIRSSAQVDPSGRQSTSSVPAARSPSINAYSEMARLTMSAQDRCCRSDIFFRSVSAGEISATVISCVISVEDASIFTSPPARFMAGADAMVDATHWLAARAATPEQSSTRMH